MADKTRYTANLVSNNNLYVDITTNRVGVGTTTPTQKLDINGNLRLRGGLYDVYNNVGVAGSVLISTGIGVSWSSAAGSGSQGTQGSQGIQGTQGSQGIQGTQGSQGIQGTQGSQGIQGTTGSQGTQGTTGSQGIQGLQGLQGRQGTQGTQGTTGSQGIQGLQGLQGRQGTQGTQGLQGNNNGGVGVATAGGTVGLGATILDFRGSGISTVTVSAGIATINIIGTSGGGTIAITDDTSTNETYYVGIASVTTGNLSVLNVSSSKLTFNPSTGNLVAGGTVTANSDEKLKENIKTIENALDKVLSLRGVEYDRIDTGDHQIGVIAQEVEKIIPEVVYPKSPAPDYETKSVAYANLIGLLIEAVKELNQKIEEK
jgi:hypothetical protein